MSLKWAGKEFDRCPHGQYVDKECKDCLIERLQNDLEERTLQHKVQLDNAWRLSQELEAAKETIRCYEAMKHGFYIRKFDGKL